MGNTPGHSLKLSGIAHWVDRNVGGSILLAACLGIACAWLFLRAFGRSCMADLSGGWWGTYVCGEATRSLWTTVSGIAAAPPLLLTWYWRTSLRAKDLTVAQDRYQLAQRAQSNERFAKAIELLSSPSIASRLGAIFALEQLSRDSSSTYYQTVVETLAAFVRDESVSRPATPPRHPQQDNHERPLIERLRTDLQAAITVLGRLERPPGVPEFAISVVNANLEGAYLRGANLEGFLFFGANLRGAVLEYANLRNANLRSPLASGRRRSDESGRGANLEAAQLAESNLEGADLRRASFAGANLREAKLDGARLEGADLARVKNLTQTQLDLAYGNDATQLPAGLVIRKRRPSSI